jgi:hypothetical protein
LRSLPQIVFFLSFYLYLKPPLNLSKITGMGTDKKIIRFFFVI